MIKRIKKAAFFLGLFLVLILGLTGASKLQASPPIEGKDYVADEVLVKFKPGTPASVVAQVHRQNNGQVKDKIARIDVQVVRVQKGQVSQKVNAYSRSPNVEYAEPNFIAQALIEPDDLNFWRQWGMDNDGQEYKAGQSGTVDADIDAPEAWNISTSSGAIRIAVLDSGIDDDHPDLATKVVTNYNFTNTADYNDFYGHGTHVAGIAAAVTNNDNGVAGVGYHVSLMNGKVLDNDGYGAYSWIVKGITWATDNGADVINMSLGGPRKSKSLEYAVNDAWNAGVVVVAAAGNSSNPSPTYPARYENCIAVAATDSNDQKASFSSYGGWVDVAAPGADIFSTFPNHPYTIGKNLEYDYGSGTSMATPHVAGIAALVWFSEYGISAQAVRQRIEKNADPIVGTGSLWIWGRVNACNAVGGNCPYLGPTPTPTLTPSPTPIPTPTPEPTPTSEPTPTPNTCSVCFKGVCDDKCNPAKDGSGCPDCL